MTRKRNNKSRNSRGGKQKRVQDTELSGVQGDDANIDHSVVIGANLGTVNFTSAIGPTDADLQRINAWTDGMVETETFVRIVKAIENGQKLFVITGEPGEGKTTLGFLILREMNQKGMTFCLVTTSENYKQRKNCDLLMFDDTFGSIAFEDKKYSDWEDTIIDVLALPEHKGSHSGTNIILIILRKTILAHLKTKLGRYASVFDDPEIVIDLTTTHRLTLSEKRKVLEIHLDRNGMHENEGDIHFICSENFTYGFPQCCRMYADRVKVNIREFFGRPLEFLDKHTNCLLKKSKHIREVLQIMICEETFQPDKEADDEKRQTLIAAANDIFFLRQEGGCFHFAHSSYQESVGISIGIEDPRFLITRCSMPCIKKYMDASAATGRALFSQLTDELKHWLLSKIAKEFGEGDYDYMKYDLLRNKENLISVLNSECCAVNTKDVQLKPMWIYAVAAGNLAAVKVLVEKGADVNAKVHGQTMLHYICKERFVDGAKCIIDKVGDIDAVDIWNRTPLYYACESSPTDELIMFLLDHGANINSVDILPLLIQNLCREGKEGFADQIIERTAIGERKERLVTAKKVYLTKEVHDSLDKRLLVHYLCHLKDLEGVKMVLESPMQFDINEPIFNSCAIHEACKGKPYRDKGELVKLLISHNADVNIPDNDGMTALHLMCGCVEGLKEVLEKATPETVNKKAHWFDLTPFMYSCIVPPHSDSLRILRLLLEYGADVNVNQDDGRNGLHYLCANGNYQCLEHLIRARKVQDVNVCLKKDIGDRCVRGQTLLHCLCNGDATKDTLELLLEQHADINRRDSQGKTPLDYLKQDPVNCVFRTRNMLHVSCPLSSREKEEKRMRRTDALRLMERKGAM